MSDPSEEYIEYTPDVTIKLDAVTEIKEGGIEWNQINDLRQELASARAKNEQLEAVDYARRNQISQLVDDLKSAMAKIEELEAALQGRTVSCICGGKPQEDI